MTNAIKRTAAGLALALAFGIILVTPAAAGPGGVCNTPQPMDPTVITPCRTCMNATNNGPTCYGEPDLRNGGNPAQNICNLTGACGQG
jgi:hypothetical protein